MDNIATPIEYECSAFTVYGFNIRTNNRTEADVGTAKIGQLWQRFGYEVAPKMSSQSSVYGIYTNYEADMHGEYDVWAGITEINEHANALEKTNVPAGRYLKFSHHGEIPNVIIELWQHIWAYFTDPNCSYERAYTADYEFYYSATHVDLFIAIK
ncbi:GyrI-like domain-containing protein [Thorsellia anophelis]|uniref:Predicted transcriptional regulator YdeE, contains AraC-type DNA-binding domain n=1 Tax=Thorsellia anophelis DSM 18579 TaxID=1123402 RepID=A0A1H9YDL9_9GAMM|nr:GyrI-like domain-containing protein [Thorsellia anophelis]SES66934.1 Predicted transcriptional regulator YdeE, contains AraC-type DNA-binding domain [Thorsellia anophelis DSM 18579]